MNSSKVQPLINFSLCIDVIRIKIRFIFTTKVLHDGITLEQDKSIIIDRRYLAGRMHLQKFLGLVFTGNRIYPDKFIFEPHGVQA